MKVQCPRCGSTVPVHGLGRKRLNIPLKNILDALQKHRSIIPAARELQCSPAYIFKTLKANGLTVKNLVGSNTGKANHDQSNTD